MSSNLRIDNPSKSKSPKLWHWIVGFLVLAIVGALFFPVDEPTEAEKQQFAQMSKMLHRSYNGDILEFDDGRMAVVINQNDYGLVIRGVVGVHGRTSYEELAKSVRVIHCEGDSDYCQVMKKFVASF